MYKKLETYLSRSTTLLEVTMGIIKRVISKTFKVSSIYTNKQIKTFIELSPI